MFEKLRAPNFDRLVTTLKGGKADCVPLLELGIHPIIKKEILGRPVVTVADDIEFMRSMGYDFVKVQPAIQMDVARTTVASVGKAADGGDAPRPLLVRRPRRRSFLLGGF